MNGASSQMIAEIKAAIEKGTLTHSEMERRLEAAIAAEIEKTDSPADMEMVRACQSLLWELDTHGKEAFVDDTERAFAAFKAKNDAKINGKNRTHRFMLRAIATAAVILLITFGADILVHRERLVGSSTDDQQQLIISGQEIDLGTVNEGQADDSLKQLQEITTTNLDDAVKVLGFAPALPQWMPDGWKLLSYYVSRSESAKWFIATYTKTGQEYELLYQANFFDDTERASSAFEQNKTGIEQTIDDGRTVYMSKNFDDTTCLWYENLTCYSLSGPENSEIFIKIIENIKETPLNETR